MEGRLAGLVGEHLLVKGGAVFWFVETDLVDVYPALVEEVLISVCHSHVLPHGHLCECVCVSVWCVWVYGCHAQG